MTYQLNNLARFTEGTSDKIYGVATNGDSAITFYGRYGNAIAAKILSLDEAEEMFAKKVKKGYVPVDKDAPEYSYLSELL